MNINYRTVVAFTISHISYTFCDAYLPYLRVVNETLNYDLTVLLNASFR
jgi:hypothetical protein